MLREENINLGELEKGGFDILSADVAKFYPLEGGLLKAADMQNGIKDEEFIIASGFGDVSEALEHTKRIYNDNCIAKSKKIIEPLFCSKGCLMGPGSGSTLNYYDKRENLLNYIDNSIKETDNTDNKYMEDTIRQYTSQSIAYSTVFSLNKIVKNGEFSEEEIREVLEKTGNAEEADQLNCQACGYASCREKAIAVLGGMAEIEMCLPYMRRRAEMRGDKIIESSPNGIVIIDEDFKIISMNQAFMKYFVCTPSLLGKPISYLMDPEPFVHLSLNKLETYEIDVKHNKNCLVCHELIYRLEKENQYVGVFVNITKNISTKKELSELRQNTLNQAKELLKHQITMAQNIAKLLGESTARGEGLVEEILHFADEEQTSHVIENRDKKDWLWDMYTSK